jgi:hypothetical protein
MMKPIREIDGYTFRWPELTSSTAQDLMARTAEHLIEKTPAERVEYIDGILPALQRPTGSVSAIDQHLVLSSLIQWREDNRDRARAAA